MLLGRKTTTTNLPYLEYLNGNIEEEREKSMKLFLSTIHFYNANICSAYGQNTNASELKKILCYEDKEVLFLWSLT